MASHWHRRSLAQKMRSIAQLHARDARGRMAGDPRQLLRQRPARGLGRAHAPQQPPCQHAGEEHVEPALDGLAARQLQQVGDERGQQRVSHGHPDRAPAR